MENKILTNEEKIENGRQIIYSEPFIAWLRKIGYDEPEDFQSIFEQEFDSGSTPEEIINDTEQGEFWYYHTGKDVMGNDNQGLSNMGFRFMEIEPAFNRLRKIFLIN
jgi:hypothetical protein